MTALAPPAYGGRVVWASEIARVVVGEFNGDGAPWVAVEEPVRDECGRVLAWELSDRDDLGAFEGEIIQRARAEGAELP